MVIFIGLPLDGEGVPVDFQEGLEIEEVGSVLPPQPFAQGLAMYTGAAAGVNEEGGVGAQEIAELAHEGIDVGGCPYVVGLACGEHRLFLAGMLGLLHHVRVIPARLQAWMNSSASRR